MVQDDLINKNMQIFSKKKKLFNILQCFGDVFFNNAETFERQDINE